MANCIIVGGGGGGILSSDVTASRANVLAGTSTVTTDSSNAVVEGTMVNRGAVIQSLPINGTYTIQAGYHNGQGRVSQNITTKSAATYYATTSDQTIASGQYLSGTQTIKAVTQQNLVASNIKKGITVYVKNGNGNLFAVTGTWEGYVAASNDLYNRGSYGSYGTLRSFMSTNSYITMDSGQITFNTPLSTIRTHSLALITPVQIDMASYSRLALEESLNISASGAESNIVSANIYVDLLNSLPTNASDALNADNRYYRLAQRSQSGHAFSWGNYTFSWTTQNATKYLRILYNCTYEGISYINAQGAWYKLTLS